MKDKSESGMAQIADFLNSFTQGEFNIGKLARAYRIKPATVKNLAYMNPGVMRVKRFGTIIEVFASGATSQTGHNVRQEGQPSSSLQKAKRPARKEIVFGKSTSKELKHKND